MPLRFIFGDQGWNDGLNSWPVEPPFVAVNSVTPVRGTLGPSGTLSSEHNSNNRGFDSASNPRNYCRFVPTDDLPKVAVGGWGQMAATGNARGPCPPCVRVTTDTQTRYYCFGPSQVSSGAVTEFGLYELATSGTGNFTKIATVVAATRNDEWHFYELVAELVGDNLEVECWFDNALVLQDTVALVGIDGVIGWAGRTTWGENTGAAALLHGGYVADYRVGPSLVQTSRPTAQGFHDEWSPAAAWADINNATVTVDGIGGVDGDRTTYPVTAFDPDLGDNIVGLQTTIIGSRSPDAVPASLIRDHPATADEVAAEFEFIEVGAELIGWQALELDPHTSAPWQWADVADYQFGLQAFAPDPGE